VIETIHFATRREQELVDITRPVQAVVHRSGIRDGLVSVYAQGATAAVMIQFFCEFDGPRSDRSVVVTVLSDR